jgi:hypothetical protein
MTLLTIFEILHTITPTQHVFYRLSKMCKNCTYINLFEYPQGEISEITNSFIIQFYNKRIIKQCYHMSTMLNLESRCMSTMLNLESRCMSSMLNVVAVNPHSTTDFKHGRVMLDIYLHSRLSKQYLDAKANTDH